MVVTCSSILVKVGVVVIFENDVSTHKKNQKMTCHPATSSVFFRFSFHFIFFFFAFFMEPKVTVQNLDFEKDMNLIEATAEELSTYLLTKVNKIVLPEPWITDKLNMDTIKSYWPFGGDRKKRGYIAHMRCCRVVDADMVVRVGHIKNWGIIVGYCDMCDKPFFYMLE